MKDNPTNEILFTISELAKILKISKNTIYRNPAKFHMFKVGGCWRANHVSLKKFSESINKADNHVLVPAGTKSNEYSKLVTSSLETEKELAALLAPRKKAKS